MSSEYVALESLAKLIYRYPSFYGMEKFDKGVPVVRGEHLGQDGRISTEWPDYWFVTPEYSAKHPKTVLDVDDIVMSVRGTVGLFARVTQSHVGAQISPNLIRISPDPTKVYPPFFYYALRDKRVVAQIAGSVASSAVPALKASDIKSAQVPVLPIDQQVGVATALHALDDRISLLRETNATLEAIAQALFKSWFVDFDPVRAKMAGRAPEGMDEATAALFPDSLEETALGSVPKGWQLVPLVDAVHFNPSRPLKKGAVAPYLDMASLGTSGHRTELPVPRELGSGTKFCNGDTLLARITPCLENGKAAFVDLLPDGQVGWGSTEFLVLRPKGSLPSYFAYLLCKHQPFLDFAIQSMVGTSGRQRIQNEALGRYPVAIPPTAIASAFGEVTSSAQSFIAANDDQAKTLAAMRDALLPRLVSGKLCLPAALSDVGA